MGLSIKQKTLLDLMARADKIMRENDIKYLLFGGSTLGALRHRGFIPWDDDIDIIMEVHDFYRLQKVFENGSIDGIELAYFHNDPYWYRSFAMLVNQYDTSYTTPVLYSGGKATGSRIDVMICDYVPKDRLEEYRADLRVYDEILADSLVVDMDAYNDIERYMEMRESEDEQGKVKYEKSFRDKLESYATGDSDELVVRFWAHELRHYEKDILFPPLLHEFEGHMFPIPAKPQEQMRLQFGNDWYIIPEENEQLSHPFTDNYFISGNNYYDDVSRFIDREESERNLRERKGLIFERAQYSMWNVAFRKNIAVQRELMRADFEKCSNWYKKKIEALDYKSFYERLNPLMSVKGIAADVEKEHKHIPDEIMKFWLKSCVYTGKYYNAIKLVKGFEIGDNLHCKEELDLIERVKKLADAFQDGRREDMRRILEEFSEEEKKDIPDCIFCIAALAKDKKGRLEDAAGEIITLCDDYLSKINNNYEIMKVKADAMYESGNIEEAMKLYEVVHEKTVNGLDLYDIEQRFNFRPRFLQEEKDPFDIMLGK